MINGLTMSEREQRGPESVPVPEPFRLGDYVQEGLQTLIAQLHSEEIDGLSALLTRERHLHMPKENGIITKA